MGLIPDDLGGDRRGEERRAIVSSELRRLVALRKREKARQMKRAQVEAEDSAPSSLPADELEAGK
jgi:hypothetical protein